MDPGNSAGSSGVDGAEIERGRLGRGFCRDTAPMQAAAPGAGERSISLNAACRLDAALPRAALYGVDTGLKANCLLSGVMILRLDGRGRSAFAMI